MEEALKLDNKATNDIVSVAANYKHVSYTLDVEKRKRIQLETHSCIVRYIMQTTIASFELNDSISPGRTDAHYLLAPCLSRLGKLSHFIEVYCIRDLMNDLLTSEGVVAALLPLKL
ncbi:hypothetical protein V6N13_030094 [Hibiscus sabdariffa]